MTASAFKRLVPVTLALAAALSPAFAAGRASAAEPWWHLNVVSAPPSKAGGEAQVIVEATNLGDENAKGGCIEVKAGTGQYTNSTCTAAGTGDFESFGPPMTVIDTLPAGLTVTNVFHEGGGGNGGDREQKEHSSCSSKAVMIGGESRTQVTCAYAWPLMPYERLIVAIDVQIASPGALKGANQASVSGGGAPAVSSERELSIEAPSSFGVATYELTPEEEGGAPYTQAGGHPFQMTTTFMLNTQSVPTVNGTVDKLEAQPLKLTKDLRFNLPPGLIGNPTPIPKCNVYVFTQEADHVPGFKCPDDTVVGVATPILAILNVGGAEYVPGTLTEPVYALEPAVGEPARFGFKTPAKKGVILDTFVRTGGDYGGTVTPQNITQLVPFIGSQVTFWGSPSDRRHDTQRGSECLAGGGAKRYWATLSGQSGRETACPTKEGQPFLIMPTSCAEVPSTSVEGDSWAEPGVFTKPFEYAFPFSFDGCNKLSFEPSIEVAPDGEEASTPTGLSVDVHVPQDASLNTSGLAESAVKRITVALPEGVAVDASGADGLEACSEGLVGFKGFGEFEQGVQTATFSPALPEPFEQGVNFCPDASKVATVKIHTPLLEHALEGSIYLASQGANPFGSLVAMYLVAHDPISGVLVKIAGEVDLNQSTGQIVTTFDNPPLPFEDAELHFFGGPRAPLGTPALCGSYTTTASFAPWSEPNYPVGSSTPPFQITSGPNHSPCANPLPFSPSLTTGSLNLQAGAFTPFTTTMSREDGQQSLQGIQLHMPPGLSGDLSSVELCPEPQADEGLCGASSLIGETIVSVGVGGSPFSVKGGKVYLTGPYEGAPFGLSIVNPAKAGPFDLEKTPRRHPACDCVVVRAKIEVDPITAALTVTTDNTGPFRIPTIIEGIPLQIQHVYVAITRPGFTFNPTNCSPMAIAGSLQSTEGASRALSVPFQVTNCATLAFKPSFKVSASGKTSRKEGATLRVTLTYPKAAWGSQANIRSVKVDLPKQLPSRLTTLQKACTDRTFTANPAACPAASRVGTAKAVTPIIPVALEGPAYFVSHGGTKFPELIIVLQGYGVTLDLHGETFISKAGITSSTFKTVPDAPVGTFQLTLPQGTYSALAANGNLCKSKLKMPTAFTAQNGMVIHQSTKIAVTGCARHAKGAHHRPRR